MSWRKALDDMGFVHVEDCIYRWQGFEFNFSSRQSVDAIAAEIWDTAQHYGEKKREKEIMSNILR